MKMFGYRQLQRICRCLGIDIGEARDWRAFWLSTTEHLRAEG